MREDEAAASAAASRRAMEDEVGMTSALAVGNVVIVLVGANVAAAKVAVSGTVELGEFVGHIVGSAVKDAAVELSSA